MSDMGTFRMEVELENPEQRGVRRSVAGLLVDTGSELSWVPAEELEALGVRREWLMRFRQATGTIVERWTGIAIVRAGNFATSDQVVFGEPNDLRLLGSRTLEGMNVTVDPVTKRLVDAGPAPAAPSGAF
jgi:predicted aspartyl protease